MMPDRPKRCATCDGPTRWARCAGCERTPADCICRQAMPEWIRRGRTGENRGKILSRAA